MASSSISINNTNNTNNTNAAPTICNTYAVRAANNRNCLNEIERETLHQNRLQWMNDLFQVQITGNCAFAQRFRSIEQTFGPVLVHPSWKDEKVFTTLAMVDTFARIMSGANRCTWLTQSQIDGINVDKSLLSRDGAAKPQAPKWWGNQDHASYKYKLVHGYSQTIDASQGMHLSKVGSTTSTEIPYAREYMIPLFLETHSQGINGAHKGRDASYQLGGDLDALLSKGNISTLISACHTCQGQKLNGRAKAMKDKAGATKTKATAPRVLDWRELDPALVHLYRPNQFTPPTTPPTTVAVAPMLPSLATEELVQSPASKATGFVNSLVVPGLGHELVNNNNDVVPSAMCQLNTPESSYYPSDEDYYFMSMDDQSALRSFSQ